MVNKINRLQTVSANMEWEGCMNKGGSYIGGEGVLSPYTLLRKVHGFHCRINNLDPFR